MNQKQITRNNNQKQINQKQINQKQINQKQINQKQINQKQINQKQIKPSNSVVTFVGGDGTKENPLKVQISASATGEDIKTRLEEVEGYEIIVKRKNQRSTVSYDLTLKNETETYHLIVTLSASQTDVINYLDSLIKLENQVIHILNQLNTTRNREL